MQEPDWAAARNALGLPADQDLELLRQAFCHGSYVRENGLPPLSSNQRLEFLGDAVLDLVLAEQLYQTYPNLSEGELTKLKAGLVRAEALHRVACEIGLGQWVLLGQGEADSGGNKKPSILSDCLEAIIAAVYLSGGWDAVCEFIGSAFAAIMEDLGAGRLNFDHKSLLQELMQANGSRPPVYRTVETRGQAHRPTFIVQVSFNGHVIGSGEGNSKQEAEQAAAGAALASRDEWLPELRGEEPQPVD